MSMSDLDLTNSFPSTFNQIDQNVLHNLTKTNSNRLNDQHEMDTKIQANVRNIFRISPDF